MDFYTLVNKYEYLTLIPYCFIMLKKKETIWLSNAR